MATPLSDIGWTEERTAALKQFWADGLSGKQIAAAMGDVTRCAVLGKVYRLDLPRRTRGRAKKIRLPFKPSRMQNRAPAKLKTRVWAVKPPRVQIAPTVAPPALRVDLLSLTAGMCRWPYGDPKAGDFFFCGRETSGAAPYCEAHCCVAFRPETAWRR